MKQPSLFLRAALKYAEVLRWPVFPLKPRSKAPLSEHGFKDATTDVEQIRAWWTKWPNANIGIPTGQNTFDVLDVDPRHGGDETLEGLILKHGPLPATVQQISGGDGRHYLFAPNGHRRGGPLAPGLDLKTDGGYIVVAPSIHPVTGKPYEWDGMDPLEKQPILSAPAWLLELCHRKDHKVDWVIPEIVPDNKKHYTIVSLAGTLRDRDLPKEAAFAACRALKFESSVSDDDIRKRVEDVYRRYPAGEDWPEPLPIGSELPAVEEFNPMLLPEALRAFVEDIGERMQVPLDYPAACLLVSMAGAVNRRARIQPKAQDSSWMVVPNLWGGIVAPPGFLKSPVLHAITAPLYLQEAVWRAEFDGKVEDYATQKEALDLRLAAWKELTKASFKPGPRLVKGGEKPPPPARPDTSIRAPVLKRLVTCDSTFEKLHELMQENPAGLLVIRDELTGWWAELDREGRQGERGFFLSAWNGDTPFTIDRVGRGSIHVPACCVSMIGGITPGRLRSYLVDALQDGPSNDGLIQRFQVLVWPDPPRNWRYVDRKPQKDQIICQMLQRILLWEPDLVTHFRFNAEAQDFFIHWLGDLERKIRSEELHPAVVSHLGKYRKLMPALGLLLSAADQLTTEGCLHDPPLVFLEHAEQAARWCGYLESHSRRVYGCVTTAAMQAAADLAAKLKAKEIGDDGTFAVRDIYRHGWSHLDTPERAMSALDVLEDAGWVRRVQNDPTPGRPPNRYIVNPRLQNAE